MFCFKLLRTLEGNNRGATAEGPARTNCTKEFKGRTRAPGKLESLQVLGYAIQQVSFVFRKLQKCSMMKLSFHFVFLVSFRLHLQFSGEIEPKAFQLCFSLFFLCYFPLPFSAFRQISNTVSFWLFGGGEYLVIIFPSCPSTCLTWMYLRILQSGSKTVHCYKQCLISDHYIFQLKIWTFHISVFPFCCVVFPPAGHRALPAVQSLTSGCLIQQEGCLGWQSTKKKQNQTLFLGLFSRAGISYIFSDQLKRWFITNRSVNTDWQKAPST